MQRILLVEDNEMNRDLISRRLKRRGFELSVALDGAEGVEKATELVPDLILMDIGLPLLNGYEATRLIKDNDSTRHIPVIGLSAHAMSGDADKALEAGCDDYDTKPIEWPRLLGKIQNLLNRSQKAQESSTTATGELTGNAQGSAAQVLVIDDNTIHRELLSGKLANLGLAVTLAGSGQEALTRLDDNKVDVILLDVELPSPTTGQTMLEVLRQRTDCQEMPILLLCTIDSIQEAIDGLEEGADELVAQPFRSEELSLRINNCLEQRRLARREARKSRELEEERQKTAHLLKTILPPALIPELVRDRKLPPRTLENVAVLTWDVMGFDQLTTALGPRESLAGLQRLIVAFEEICREHDVQTLRTGGEAVLAAAGLFTAPAPQLETTALAAMRAANQLQRAAPDLCSGWHLRFGLHAGPVTAGVVGHHTCQFGLWGPTVQIATYLRNQARTSGLYVSGGIWQPAADHCQGEQIGQKTLGDGTELLIHRVDTVRT